MQNLLVLCAAISLSGCGGGTAGSDPAATRTAPASTSAAPVINGTPALEVQEGSAYLFRPQASSPGGATLTFFIVGKPTWASFDVSSGALAGAPGLADVGTSAPITISVSDGARTANLAVFTITVNAAAAAGTVTLSWVAPSENADGSPLSDLSGFRIYYGTDSATLGNIVQVAGAGATRQVISGLASGTWYFSMSSVTTAGVESALTAPLSHTVT